MKMRKAIGIIVLTILVGLAFLYLWAGAQTRAARSGAEEYFSALARGQIPPHIEGEALQLAENLLEFGMPKVTVARVRLVAVGKARAKIRLQGAEGGDFFLPLERVGGKWRPGGIQSSLSVVADTLPRLALKVGDATLRKALQPLGSDKLLTLQADRVEGLNQGWLEMAPYFAAFHDDQPTDLIVGMTDLALYQHNGRLAAAVAAEPYGPRLIRVNLSTTGHGSIYHEKVKLSSSRGWQVTEAVTGRQISLPPGTVELQARDEKILMDSQEFAHRLLFAPGNGDGQLEFSSISRSGGPPSYYGTLEVANFGGKLVVVNEVPLEQYLYYVVPGEMPAYFGPQALEVQAVVARTFALGNLYASQWRSTSAHVVDSVLSQVYNNGGTNSSAIAAVEATRGEYLAANGSPAAVRFFSTSCGYTANAHQVWAGKDGFPGTPIPWLTARPQHPREPMDLAGEEAFASFIKKPPAGAYDAKSPWFRWHAAIPVGQLEEIIRENLRQVFADNPEVLLVQTGDGFAPVRTMPDDPLGELLDLIPAQRGAGGLLMAVDIVGSRGTWRVQREYYIRQVLRPQALGGPAIELVLHDGSKRVNFNLLPSAFVTWELEREGEQLKAVRFFGGGFGHGVGMSQYGVRELAALGWSRKQILEHYFPGTVVTKMP
jgi:stage II sporulation protein D